MGKCCFEVELGEAGCWWCLESAMMIIGEWCCGCGIIVVGIYGLVRCVGSQWLSSDSSGGE